jgi:hypothetical protein
MSPPTSPSRCGRGAAYQTTPGALDLDPASAVACARLVEDEALLVRDLVQAPAAVRSRVERIRAGFSPAPRSG